MTPDNLPHQPTPFIGRSGELNAITALLADPACRLLTLVGPGGIGKTRLAVEIGRRLLPDFPDGVFLVPLAQLDTQDSVAVAAAQAIGYRFHEGDDPRRQLLNYLRGKRLLLIFDNFEHLLSRADMLADIVHAAPDVQLMATSRETLNLQEEWVRHVVGMRVPPADAAPAELTGYSAIHLFAERAHRVSGDFALEDEYDAVIAICRLVEGMPLGIELAAAWRKAMPCAEIAAEIRRNVDFLATTMRNMPARHRSMRVVFESSWERLTPEEQRVLAGLSIFRPGFGRDAARAVADATPALLLALVDKSLLHHREDGRYEMHELLRQFAQGKLEALPEDNLRVRHAHCAYYAGLIAAQTVRLQGNPLEEWGQLAALNAIEAELDNIRAAWMIAVHHHLLADWHRLLHGLNLYYTMRPRLLESLELLGGTLHYLESADAPDWPDDTDHTVLWGYLNVMLAGVLRAMHHRDPSAERLAKAEAALRPLDHTAHPDLPLILLSIARMHVLPTDDPDQARYWIQRVLEASRAAGNRWGEAQALRMLGDLAHDTINYADSPRLYQQALDLSCAINDQWGIGFALGCLGEVAYTKGDYAEAERLYRQELAIAEAIGAPYDIGWTLVRIGSMTFPLGQYAETRAIYEEQVIPLAHDLGEQSMHGWALNALGELAMVEGDWNTARALISEGLARLESIDSRRGMGWNMLYLGAIALAQGRLDEADRHIADGMAQFKRRGGDPWGESAALYHRGELATAHGDYTAARRDLLDSLRIAVDCQSIMLLLRHMVGMGRLLAATGDPAEAIALLTMVQAHPATWQNSRDDAAHLVASITADLPPEAIQTAIQRGEALTPDAAIAALLHGYTPSAPPVPRPAPGFRQEAPLLVETPTARELEILRLIEAGFSNKAIADELVISLSTVKKHINHLYGKLAVTSRTQALARARDLGLL
jgi:predicted ATPase/DNA-binding CsgD family transcriptional regulator